MILNLRVDHKIADIQSMENISKDMDELFAQLQEKYSVLPLIKKIAKLKTEKILQPV